MEYLSVSDFAEAAGVTPQAIYKRIKSDLAPFTKQTPNGKTVSTEALKLFRVDSAIDNTAKIEALEKENESLRKLNTELNQRFIEQNEKLLEILANQAKQAENYQILLAQNQQLTQQLLAPPEPVEPVEESKQPVKKPSLFKRIFTKSH